MTTLVAWAAVDNDRITSVYVASDSRLSWKDGNKWDYGCKIFISRRLPLVFGYSGDSTLPSLFINQLIGLIDDGVIVSEDLEDIRSSAENILDEIVRSYRIDSSNFTIICLYRIFLLKKVSFQFFKITCENKKINYSKIKDILPGDEAIVHISGSGGKIFKEIYGSNEKFEQNLRLKDDARFDFVTRQKIASRFAFKSLVATIESGRDPATGGAIQLAGLLRTTPAEVFGVVLHGKRYYMGVPVDPALGDLREISWKDIDMKNVDPLLFNKLSVSKRRYRSLILRRKAILQ